MSRTSFKRKFPAIVTYCTAVIMLGESVSRDKADALGRGEGVGKRYLRLTVKIKYFMIDILAGAVYRWTIIPQFSTVWI